MDDRRSEKPRHPGDADRLPSYPRRHTCSFPAFKHPGQPGVVPRGKSSVGLVRIACRTGGHVKPDVTGEAGSMMMRGGHILLFLLLKCVCIFDIFGELITLVRMDQENQRLGCINPDP